MGFVCAGTVEADAGFGRLPLPLDYWFPVFARPDLWSPYWPLPLWRWALPTCAAADFTSIFPILIGGLFMKVVVVKSPKMFRGLLRLMFGIKKEA